MAFTKPTININPDESEKPKYHHGFTESQVQEILHKKELIDKRDIITSPVTREEFRTIIIPWLRIHRTEEFILKEVKVKPPKAPKVIKVKKPTKAQIKKRLNDLIFQIALGNELNEDDKAFYDEHTKDLQI
jgi:hypothetical protein